MGLFSIEMARLALGVRAVGLTGRINTMRLATGKVSEGEQHDIGPAVAHLGNLKFALDESAVLTPMQLRAKARRLQKRQGLSALFVDYLRIVDAGTSGKQRDENRTLELAHMSRGSSNSRKT